jgi:glycosyltransferase involved in cell wall biosynthesis
LLVVGYDLKFLKTAIPHIEKYYCVKIDEWLGHNRHCENKSEELLEWAEIIFCEWLLGNAVWYAENKRADQKLIVRMHRFELTTDYYRKIDDSKVDRYITVSVYFFEKLIEYLRCAREKVRLIPNMLEIDKYEQSYDRDKVYNLAIIGILPARKGYLKALRILKELIKKDRRYNLRVYGKLPNELSWIKNNVKEFRYFENCDRFIEKHQLTDHVHIKGWADVTKELSDIGFVLSTSDSEKISESFHIAPADGFAAGGQGLLMNWNGVEYIYPARYIFESEGQIAEYIIEAAEWPKFERSRQAGHNLVANRYNMKRFIENIRNVF